MHREQTLLLTISTELIMEPTLKELVERAGARGYNIGDVASEWGTRGNRTGQLESGQSFIMTPLRLMFVTALLMVSEMLGGLEGYAKKATGMGVWGMVLILAQ